MDDNGYFAQFDVKKLKLSLNKGYNKNNTKADDLIADCKIAFNNVYSQFGWDRNNRAWSYFRQFLVDGFLAFEIIFDDLKHPTKILAFKELDPATLEPDIYTFENGEEMLVWYQFRGDKQREHMILDSNLIYISWSQTNSATMTDFSYNNTSLISYVEGLRHPYQILSQLEESYIMWNMQNAQRRMKVTVPVGEMNDAKTQAEINKVRSEYEEEIFMDRDSGDVIVNGEPRFNFSKTYFIPDHNGQKMDIEEISPEGYDLSSTEKLEFFWRKFIMQSQVPVNRFMLNISSPPQNSMANDALVSREEYAFARFIQRIQSVFKEVLVKPLWIQICIMHPELAGIDYLRQCLGVVFNEENLFMLAKKRQVVNDGASTVSTLAGIVGPDQKPLFAAEWLIQEFMGLSDQDMELNRKYKEAEVIKQVEMSKLLKKHNKDAGNQQDANGAGGDMSMADALGGGGFGGGDFGGTGDFGGGDFGGSDFGGGGDMSGGDIGGDAGDMGGGDFGEAPAAEPAAEPTSAE